MTSTNINKHNEEIDKFTYTAGKEDEGKQYFELLKQNFVFSSRFRSKIKRDSLARVNGKVEKMYKKAKEGDVLSIVLPKERSDFEPENIDFEIAYEDDDLLIINKPNGYVVHPTKGHPSHTMANGIMHYMNESGQSFKIRFINRLDMDTTGLLIVGKNSYSQEELSKSMKADKVKKSYYALVEGVIEENAGKIDLPIGRPDEISVKRAVMKDGYPSVTNYEVVERFSGSTLVKLDLETGRTHQIRVHMSHIGHPLLSDSLYGGSESPLISRQALHAYRLSFPHPVTKKILSVECELPVDFKYALAKLKDGAK